MGEEEKEVWWWEGPGWEARIAIGGDERGCGRLEAGACSGDCIEEE